MARKRQFPAEPPASVEPLRVSIPMATYLVGESKSRLYQKIRAGELRTVKEGSKTLITMTELRRYVSATDPVQLELPLDHRPNNARGS